MKPPVPIHDPRFVYVDSAHTNIRERFARVRAELAKQPPPAANVRPITRERKA
jgi:hypothetical protein